MMNKSIMDMDGFVDNENVNVVSVDSVDENNPVQGLTSQEHDEQGYRAGLCSGGEN
jgi:hypothetical protein